MGTREPADKFPLWGFTGAIPWCHEFRDRFVYFGSGKAAALPAGR